MVTSISDGVRFDPELLDTACILAFDPGAERMGFAALQKCGPEDLTNKPPIVLGSGCVGLKREEKEPYQQYRLRLIEYWVDQADRLLSLFRPTLVVSEIVPVQGFSNASQSLLAASAITTVQAIAIQACYPVEQLSAATVKKKVGGHGRATKVQVRNGVYQLIPSTKDFHQEWKSIFDVSDAFAVGLTYLGFANGTR